MYQCQIWEVLVATALSGKQQTFMKQYFQRPIFDAIKFQIQSAFFRIRPDMLRL